MIFAHDRKLFSQLLNDPSPGRAAQSVGRLTENPRVPGSIPFSDSRKAVVSYLRKYGNFTLDNRVGSLSLSLSMSMNSVVRSTDRPDMTIDVYRGRKATTRIGWT